MSLFVFLMLAGCGDDGFIFIAINTGVVTSGDACQGQFHMRNEGGAVLVIIIGDDTDIFLASGIVGTCGDIHSGTRASVRGPTEDGQVTAKQIQLR